MPRGAGPAATVAEAIVGVGGPVGGPDVPCREAGPREPPPASPADGPRCSPPFMYVALGTDAVRKAPVLIPSEMRPRTWPAPAWMALRGRVLGEVELKGARACGSKTSQSPGPSWDFGILLERMGEGGEG